MATLGIIGVGHLGNYLVTGIRRGGWTDPIVLSPRNAEVVARLAKDHNAKVLPDNRSVAEAADLIILATPPAVALEVVSQLPLRREHVLISVIMGLAIDRLKEHAPTAGAIVRALPLSSAEVAASPTLIFPAHRDVESLFRCCGTPVPLPNEDALDIGAALFCAYGSVLALVNVLAAAGVSVGLPPDTARALVARLTEGAARTAAEKVDIELDRLADQCAPPGSFTRRFRDQLENDAALAAWASAFRALAADLARR